MLIKNENHSNIRRNRNTEVKVRAWLTGVGPVQTCLPSRDLDQPAGQVSVPPGRGGGLSTPTRMGGQSPSRIEGVGLTDSLQDGGSLSQWDGALSPRRMGLTTPARLGSLPQQDGGSLPQQDGGHSPRRMGAHSPSRGFTPQQVGGCHSLQQDGGHSPSRMGLTPPAEWGAHSLPHMGMSLLSAFITTEDIVMVIGMASK